MSRKAKQIAAKQPWYKENPFWGGVGGFISFSLAGLGFGMTGYPTLGKGLLWVSFPWGFFTVWCVVNGLTQITRRRIAGMIAGCVLVVFVVWWSQGLLPKPTVQLALYMTGLDKFVKPGTVARILFFRHDRTAHASIFGNGMDSPWDWTDSKGTIIPPEFMGVITVSNHGFSQVFNLTMHIGGNFTTTGDVNKKIEATASTDVMIDAIIPGQTILICVVNQSDRWIDVVLPDQAEMEVQGEQGRKKVTLSLRPTLPFLVPPSSHTWNSNGTIGPRSNWRGSNK